MDDLTQKLDRLLSSPDGMKQIEELMSAFGGAPASEAPAPRQDAPGTSSFPDMGMLLKLAPLLSQLGQQDDAAALLHALRPHLQTERQKRLDEAGQLLRLIRLLPLLQGFAKGGEEP